MAEGGRIDKRQARRSFSRAAGSYDAAAVLQRELGSRLQERLDGVRIAPQLVLDLGVGTGADLPGLMARFPKARLLGLDLALPMLERARRRGRWLRRPLCICADMEALPLQDRCVDLIYSNLALQWAGDLARVLAECGRVLRPGGLLHFATLGPDTLMELREAWARVDGLAHVSQFPDLHDVGDLLLQLGFADPVMSMEKLTLTYQDLDGLIADLRAIGAQNATPGRPRGLAGRSRMAQLRRAYEAFRRDGRLPATYEVIYGHAWIGEAAPARQPATEFRISANSIKRRRMADK